MFFIKKCVKGEYPDLNREQAVPHTVTLPLSYTHLKFKLFLNKLNYNYRKKKKELRKLIFFFIYTLYILYVGVVRTLNRKYQKFMTYQLVHNIS